MLPKAAQFSRKGIGIAVGLLFAGVFGFVAFLSYTNRAAPELELIFLRYSNQGRTDVDVGRAAFLLLTNRTSNTFMLCMPAGSPKSIFMTNNLGNIFALNNPTTTAKRSNPWNPSENSWEVNCAFEDKTAQGITNWTQQLLSGPGQSIFLPVGPNTGVVIRVPLPRKVIERKAAVILTGTPSNPAPWKNGPWTRSMKTVLRSGIVHSGAMHVWCATRLRYPGRTDGKPDDFSDE